MRLRCLIASASLLIMGDAARVWAASGSGTLGRTSSASAQILLSVGTVTRVSGLGDVVLERTKGRGAELAAKRDACIFSNAGSSGHAVTLSSANADRNGQPRLSNGQGRYMTYDVRWNESASGVAATKLPGCAGRGKGELAIAVVQPQQGAVDRAMFADVLTVLVAPK